MSYNMYFHFDVCRNKKKEFNKPLGQTDPIDHGIISVESHSMSTTNGQMGDEEIWRTERRVALVNKYAATKPKVKTRHMHQLHLHTVLKAAFGIFEVCFLSLFNKKNIEPYKNKYYIFKQ